MIGRPSAAVTIRDAADADDDGDVDTVDFQTFSNCFNGENNPPQSGCQNPFADLDADGDMDSADFQTFSNCFNSQDNPPQAACG